MPMNCAAAGGKWHLDEVFIKINGEWQYLWRAVDQDSNILDILVQNRQGKAATRRFFRRLMKQTGGVPRVIVTDKLRSDGAAHREVMPFPEHRSHKGLNSRAENGHQPTRRRERGHERLPQRWSGAAVLVRVQRRLTPASGPDAPDDRTSLPSRDGRPLRHLGPHHRASPNCPPWPDHRPGTRYHHTLAAIRHPLRPTT